MLKVIIILALLSPGLAFAEDFSDGSALEQVLSVAELGLTAVSNLATAVDSITDSKVENRKDKPKDISRQIDLDNE